MIGKGSMVALKGHAQFPMVVAFMNTKAENPALRRDDEARVCWLDRNGVPHAETYPLELLEELDG